MITSLHVKNFQSHPDLHVDFHKGINVFIGSSESGKSAALRSLCWLIENRPQGDSILSHWICDAESKKITGECFVEITLDSDWTVTRRRTAAENQYLLRSPEGEQTVFNAVGKAETPEEIRRILNFTELNISKQHDKPFLVSETSGEVSRFLNKVIRLDIIDDVLRTAETERRRLNSSVRDTEELVTRVSRDLEGYAWMQEAQPLVEKWEELQRDSQRYTEEIQDLSAAVEQRQRQEIVLLRYRNLPEAVALLHTLRKQLEAEEKIKTEMTDLDTAVQQYDRYNTVVQRYGSLQEVSQLLLQLRERLSLREELLRAGRELRSDLDSLEKQEEILRRRESIQKADQDLHTLKVLLDNGETMQQKCLELQQDLTVFQERREAVERWKKLLVSLRGLLPENCPTCGQPLLRRV